jgi:hypothetical protein
MCEPPQPAADTTTSRGASHFIQSTYDHGGAKRHSAPAQVTVCYKRVKSAACPWPTPTQSVASP